MGLDELIGDKRNAILAVAQRHGASNVRVIGSTARNQARVDSDLDLLVDLEEGRTLLDHAALMLELEELLGRKVDVAVAGGLKERVRERVLAESIPL